ncbi:MAG: hypothetical protein AAFP97_06705 [Pseudomonadota bacterium]
MFRRLLKRRSPGADGFAMPLTLAVLLILSYVIAVGLQRIEVSQAEARLSSATTADVLDATLVEQDVVWRGVLELLAKPIAGVAANNYGARAPDNSWTANARAYLWSPTYRELGRDFPTALVVIHDEASKIDLNNTDEAYLRFIAERAQLGPGNTDRAVTELQNYMNARRPLPLSADDSLRIPQRSGLLDPLEVCALQYWSRWELCSRPEAFRELFTADVGLIPNIRMMTPEAARFLLREGFSTDILELEREWTSQRITYGFYNPLSGIGTGGQRFTVTIIPQSAQRAFRFEIDSRVQETGDPFAIRYRRYLPADALLDDYRVRFPGAVSQFLSQ